VLKVEIVFEERVFWSCSGRRFTHEDPVFRTDRLAFEFRYLFLQGKLALFMCGQRCKSASRTFPLSSGRKQIEVRRESPVEDLH
jgi:hypothetical protein